MIADFFSADCVVVHRHYLLSFSSFVYHVKKMKMMMNLMTKSMNVDDVYGDDDDALDYTSMIWNYRREIKENDLINFFFFSTGKNKIKKNKANKIQHTIPDCKKRR